MHRSIFASKVGQPIHNDFTWQCAGVVPSPPMHATAAKLMRLLLDLLQPQPLLGGQTSLLGPRFVRPLMLSYGFGVFGCGYCDWMSFLVHIYDVDKDDIVDLDLTVSVAEKEFRPLVAV